MDGRRWLRAVLGRETPFSLLDERLGPRKADALARLGEERTAEYEKAMRRKRDGF